MKTAKEVRLTERNVVQQLFRLTIPMIFGMLESSGYFFVGQLMPNLTTINYFIFVFYVLLALVGFEF
ncbi:hypothetical protein [Halanaerobaculum tunisiense]